MLPKISTCLPAPPPNQVSFIGIEKEKQLASQDMCREKKPNNPKPAPTAANKQSCHEQSVRGTIPRPIAKPRICHSIAGSSGKQPNMQPIDNRQYQEPGVKRARFFYCPFKSFP
jgi:hypothetical protein